MNRAAGAGAVVLAVVVLTPLMAFVAMGDPPLAHEPSSAAAADIPPDLLAAYRGAAAACGLSWEVLAAVGKVASDHGRSLSAAVGSPPAPNGAAGPMGLLPAVWAAAGSGDVHHPGDAIRATARFLCHQGATDPARLPAALAALDPAADVLPILAVAALYRATPAGAAKPVSVAT